MKQEWGQGEIGIFKKLADQGKLNIRINAMLGEQERPVFETDNLEEYFKSNRIESYADDYLNTSIAYYPIVFSM
ncbi:MAG: hypothetical protein ACLFN1_04955 [Bacteroidales bacterium]